MSLPSDTITNVVTSQPTVRDSSQDTVTTFTRVGNTLESNEPLMEAPPVTEEPRFSQFHPMMSEVDEEEKRRQAEELAKANTSTSCCTCDDAVDWFDCTLDCADLCGCCDCSGDTGGDTGCCDCCGGSGDAGNGDNDWDCCGGAGDCGDCDCGSD